MSQKKKKLTAKTPVAVSIEVPRQTHQLFPSWTFKWMSIIVFVIAAGVYFNTIFNDYALDDGIVITENQFTHKGFAGISEILSNEGFANLEGGNANLSGGRYRPLSVVTFAIEYGIFGPKPSISHLINALLYGFLCVLIFYFLKQFVFKTNISAALIATIIFAVHPLHTDVVSNIKGRDELLSLLLLVACLIFYLKYTITKKGSLLFYSLTAYFFSLLAKENGITFLAVIPLTLYFFRDKKLRQSFISAIPFFLVFIFYFLIRLKITGMQVSGDADEIMNAPFLLASPEQAIATKIMILGKGLLMLIYPHPLSFDYSYNQVPYVHFSDWRCLLSLAVNGILVFIALRLFRRRHILSFSILFYYITLSIVTNFVFDVGSPFNERFLFQPSLGFSIAVAWLLTSLAGLKQGNPIYKTAASLLFFSFIIAGAIKTISRNPEWKSNDTLFAADAKHAPNSAKTNNFAAVALLRQSDNVKDSVQKNMFFEKAIPGFKKSLEIDPDFADPYINLGNIYAQQGKLDLAKEVLTKARSIHPDVPALKTNLQYLAQRYELEATKQYGAHNMTAAIMAANSSLECFPGNVKLLYNLGGYYVNTQNLVKAKEMWTRALQLDPGNKEIRSWLDRISAVPLPKN